MPSLQCEHRVFYGAAGARYRPWKRLQPDEVHLPVDDNYFSLPDKVQSAVQWALNNGYDAVLKVDDDAYVNGSNLAQSFEQVAKRDYVGYVGIFLSFIAGGAYYLSRRAMEVIANERQPSTVPANGPRSDLCYEDDWIASALRRNLIWPTDDRRFVFATGAPMQSVTPDTIVDFEYPGVGMFKRHNKDRSEEEWMIPSLEWRTQDLEYRVDTMAHPPKKLL